MAKAKAPRPSGGWVIRKQRVLRQHCMPPPFGRLGYPSPAELCKSHNSSRGNPAQTL